MNDLERARRVFGSVGYAMELTGCVIEQVAPGFARCSLKIEDKHRNGLGHVMGGAIYTLADMAYAVASNFDRDVFVTSSSHIYFLKSADAGDEVAHATIGGTLVKKRAT